MGLSRGLRRVGIRCALEKAMNPAEFVETVKAYRGVTAHWHGALWLCSVRSKLRLPKDEFDRLALAAHDAGLVELSRADLVEAMDPRYVAESAIDLGHYSLHFLRLPEES